MIDWLFAHGRLQAPALVLPKGETFSYAALKTRIEEKAAALHTALGDIAARAIAVDIAEPEEALITLLAIARSGGVMLPFDGKLAARAQRIQERVRPLGVVAGAVSKRDDARAFAPEVALVLPTSGSRGEPKNVLLARAGLQTNIDAILTYLPANARNAVVLPLAYSYALVGQIMTTFRAGGTVLLLSPLAFAAQQMEAMVALRAEGLSSVPTSLAALADLQNERKEEGKPVAQLKYVASAGAALDLGLAAKVKAAFSGARFFNQYGLTEASPRVTALSDDEPAFAKGSIGRALLGIEVFAADDNGACLPANEEGELIVRGPALMLGYLDDDKGTQRALAPYGLRSGDRGFVDEQGYVFHRGRFDDLVKCAGERVSLDEVANALRKAPLVKDAAVVALPDAKDGARLVGFVVADNSPALRKPELLRGVRQHLQNELSPAKRPRKFVVVEALPKTPTGKLDMPALRRQAEEEA